MPTILSDFLKELDVRHTVTNSDKAFNTMTFTTLFGFVHTLAGYGVDSEALRVTDKSQIQQIPLPFLAQEGSSFVIVTGFGKDENGKPTVSYIYYHKRYTVPLEKFCDKWTGVVLLAYPKPEACEPSYSHNRFLELIGDAKRWALMLFGALLIVWGFVSSGLWHDMSAWFLMAVNMAGLIVTWLLVLKSLKVHSVSADRICGILEEHGCDTVLEQKASSFYGIFGWAEVGLTYFSVSTLILLLFPGQIHTLALLNGCCLPFTFWSIWYQRFRIHTWCTLCVTTQALLWCQFFCYLAGGWWHGVFPLHWSLVPIIATYGAVLLTINRVMQFIEHRSTVSV